MEPGAIPTDVAYALSALVEMFFYGIYTCLFLSALSVMLKGKSSKSRTTVSAWIFLITTTIMYMVATLHITISLYRFLRAFVLLVDPSGPLGYYLDFTRWDYALNNIVLCVMTWLGDALAIYRCYHVWNRNFWVILLPVLLITATIGINTYTIYWASHPFNPSFDVGMFVSLLSSIYPLAFAQNLMTTGLISLKIWRQHKASIEAGVLDHGSRISLIQILRIIVESAMVYTLQILLVIILFFKGDNFQIIVQSAIVPSIGIVFVLIAVRVHNAKSKNVSGRSDFGTVPIWLEDSDGVMADLSAQGSSLPGGGGSSQVTEKFDDQKDSEPCSSLSYVPQNCTSDDNK